MMMTPLGIAATKKHHAVVNMLVKKLVDEQKFSRKQVEWMHNAENPMQQVHVYRSLVSIFQQKAALKSLIQYDVIAAIMRGIKRFNKASVQSSGLQLLIQCLELEEGVAVAKETNLKRDVMDACREFMGDAVISHLVNNVTGVL